MPAINGSTVLLQVRTSTGPDVFTTIGGQRGMTIERSGGAIDTSSKDSYDATSVPGRRSSKLSGSVLYVPSDAAKTALLAAYNTNPPALIRVRRTAPGGEAAQVCDAVITSLHEEHPDDDASMFSIELQLSGPWT